MNKGKGGVCDQERGGEDSVTGDVWLTIEFACFVSPVPQVVFSLNSLVGMLGLCGVEGYSWLGL